VCVLLVACKQPQDVLVASEIMLKVINCLVQAIDNGNSSTGKDEYAELRLNHIGVLRLRSKISIVCYLHWHQAQVKKTLAREMLACPCPEEQNPKVTR
jgi:hypothetical protein